MNGENIRLGSNPDDRVAEMTGLLELGMHQDALNKTRAVISQEQLSADEFCEAVGAILIAEGDCKLWENLVRAAYDRLSESDQQEARGAMLSFYTTIKDMETAAKFIPEDSNSPILLMQSMWALLETKRRDEAKTIFERCREMEADVDGAELNYLLTAMADYCQQTGQLAEAERYWLRSSELDEPMLQNALSGLVKIQAARALEHVQRGLEQIEKFKGNICKATMTILPGNHDQVLADAKKELETYRGTLEKIVPGNDLWRFGQEQNAQ
jgi:tetratricopeptide (TPR) repeat protein